MTELPFSQACENNKLPIWQTLQDYFAGVDNVLEIGSGTGQHATFFAARLPDSRWQATDRAEYLPGLAARIAAAGLRNLPAPLELDVTRPWPVVEAAAMFTANTLHIMDWPAVEALFRGAGSTLIAGGYFCIYGPFNYRGAYTSDSNAAFDQMLRGRDPASGIRDIADVTRLGSAAGLQLIADQPMPANNRLLVFRRR